jgi:starch phosphorylase
MSSEFNGSTWKMPYKPVAKYSKKVAYFCMEFGIDQALKIYSGGLGYLAGSHMRSAYQLKQNMIGIGMLWRYGYYDQDKDEKGNMKALFRRKFYTYLRDSGLDIEVSIKGYPVKVKALYLDPKIFGTVPMYFLTTDFPSNDSLSRSITTRLYHPNDATRVAQSIVLGIGGAKLVEKLGGVDLYHINEAHALPVGFHLYKKYGSLEKMKEKLVFTTHTPEMAGNSVRPMHLLHEMGFFADVDLPTVRNMTGMQGHDFEYTPSALRMAKKSNSVSQLHGDVSRKMWKDYKDTSEIIAITNAQDQEYWQDKELAAALKKDNDKALIKRKKELKKELFKVVADQEGDLFSEDVLTIVWARRFAAYKRADMMMRDYERFEKLIKNTKYPIQIIWAGKPYPGDMGAINVFNYISSITYKKKGIATLTGYELELSASLKKGADIWLNTPRRPQEASGTSGMTAAMNGAINLSINDGWIPEFALPGRNAFIIPEADTSKSIQEQDDHDQKHLMSLIEDTILPMYYDKPAEWTRIMKQSMKDVLPYFDSKRMADEYYMKLYQ